MNNWQTFTKGFFKENPTFVLLLGMCPTLGVTTSAINGLGMGLATAFVLVLSNLAISLVANLIPDKTGEIKMKKVDVMQYVGWREGKYVFENTALVDIMRTLERWYDIDVVYVDPVVKDYHFTGDLERYESINVFLNFIETGGDVKFKTEGKTIIIGKK